MHENTQKVKSDLISWYDGVARKPTKQTSWIDALYAVQTEQFLPAVMAARAAKAVSPGEYRKAKKALPAVTFGGTFNGRRAADAVLQTTGIIIPDLDHLEDVEDVFETLQGDPKILFAFRSPGGDGIKAGVRADGIAGDAEHKAFYASVEHYFRQQYGLKIDPACKDISRLTFMSADKNLHLNLDAELFDVFAWTPPQQEAPERPAVGERAESCPSTLRYAWAVLESACSEIANSPEGSQHLTRRDQARKVGGYMHYGLDDAEVTAHLEHAVRESGAKDHHAAMKTIRDGLDHGKEHPCSIPKLNHSESLNTHETHTSHVSHEDHEDHNGSQGSHSLTETHTDSRKLTLTHTSHRRFNGNLTVAIRQFVEENQGSFTNADIDRELCLSHPSDKTLRRRALSDLGKEKKIKKDQRASGKWHILSQDFEFVDILSSHSGHFPMDLPLGLSQMVNIYPHSICVVAGTTNSGKTAFLLDVLKRNMGQDYGLMYQMSEMGASEYRSRVQKLLPHSGGLEDWAGRVRAVSRSANFDGPISHVNRDGLTVVDFLEEVEGEYFRITSDIRSIYDALGDGVCWIALQKHSQQAMGRGGEGTAEKSRLYLTIDTLVHNPHSTISAIKIIKAKDYNGRNPNGLEMHVRITGGHKIEPVESFGDKWRYVSSTQRVALIQQYEAAQNCDGTPPQQEENPILYRVQLSDGTLGAVRQDQVEIWQANNPAVDVNEKLRWIEKVSREGDFKGKPLTKKDWFFRVSAFCSKP